MIKRLAPLRAAHGREPGRGMLALMPAVFAGDAAHRAGPLELFQRHRAPGVTGRLGIAASEHVQRIARREQIENLIPAPC